MPYIGEVAIETRSKAHFRHCHEDRIVFGDPEHIATPERQVLYFFDFSGAELLRILLLLLNFDEFAELSARSEVHSVQQLSEIARKLLSSVFNVCVLC